MKELTDVSLESVSKDLLKEIENFIDEVLTYGNSNEQWFLDFLDELNKQSVRC